MNLDTVLRRLPMWYMAATDVRRRDRIRCFYLRSEPGVGKSTVLSMAPELVSKHTGKNIGLVVLSAPLLTTMDAVGYLVPKKLPDGRAISVFTEPFWFTTDEGKHISEYDGVIIVVDEIDKADLDVKKAVGELALSGRLGPHRLRDTDVVWMAGNRAGDRSGSTKELDHLINRRCEINIVGSIDAWAGYALDNGVMHTTIAFARDNTHIVFSGTVPEKQGPWCTPRSLCMADGYLQSIGGTEDNIPDDAATMEEVGGMIGDAAASQLFATIRLDRKMPSIEEIVANPSKVRVPLDAPDALMLICYKLAHKVTKETAGPIVEYVNRMQKEFGTIFATSACRRDPKLVMHPAFDKWAEDNASLMAAIGRQA